MLLISKQRYDAEMQKKEDNENGALNEEKDASEMMMQTSTEFNNDVSGDNQLGNLKYLIEIAVSKKYKNKMIQLLLYFKNHTALKWTDKGEVVINGNIISKSHIIDLVRDLIVPVGKRTPPQGAHDFTAFLNTIHIPESLISNGQRKRYLQRMSEKEKDDESEKEHKRERSTDEDYDNPEEKEKQITREEKMPSDMNFYVQRDVSRLFNKPSVKKRKWHRIDSFF